MNLSSILKRSAVLALTAALMGGEATALAQHGLHYTLPNHTLSITTTDTPPTPLGTRWVSNTTTRPLPSDRYIRAVLRAGGIPPCRWEDGSGQRGSCVIDFATFGSNPNADGDVVVLVPTGINAQKRTVVLINR